ncbi:MAG: hypothetical protein ABSF61_03780 [Anaerolineales bacterium]|jgi:hypothetical protein
MTLFRLTLSLTAVFFGQDNAGPAQYYVEGAVDLLRALLGEHNLDGEYEHPGLLRVATPTLYGLEW